MTRVYAKQVLHLVKCYIEDNLYPSRIVIEGTRTKLVMFFNCALEIIEIRKNKACVLTPYQDVLLFSTLKNMKILCASTPYQDVFSALKHIE